MGTKVKELAKVMDLKSDNTGCITCRNFPKSHITAEDVWTNLLSGEWSKVEYKANSIDIWQ